VQNTNLFRVRWQRNGSFDFAEGLASCVGAKANVPFVGWQLNFKIFVRWVKKLKHIWVGNECRDICLSVSFFIPSLIFNFHCQFAVSLSFFRLCITVGGCFSPRNLLNFLVKVHIVFKIYQNYHVCLSCGVKADTSWR